MSLAEKIKETFSKKAKLLQGHQPSRAPHLGHLSDDTRGNAKGGKSLSCLSLVKKITGKFSKGAKTLGGHRASRAPPSTPPDDIRADSKGDNKGGNLSGLSLAKGIKGMFSKRPRSWKSHRASRAPSTTHWPSPAVDTRGDAKGGIGSGTGAGSIRNGVLSVLRVVHASLDGVPVPGLKSVIGGFLEVVSQLERFGANADAIRQLQHNIELFVHSISEPLKQYGAKDPVPHGISRAIEAVSTEIAATTAPLQSYLDKNPAYLWANRDKIEGDVRLAGERIRGAVAAFQASQAIQVHIGMISMQKDVQIQFEVGFMGKSR
ncbi:uncharacterized protein EI90DRAFT_66839 [Cantharellus anzutake]|uniref:uncharacterized protein n=1 Tax=Cantharellus anzutake TaxID=1750568 RepID=UPI0019042531|nr:uncharacterized protein EI90DRAFT_66839 [Cantharellus anzutake]KAF8344309.1 hypothetical protein EI90DRAFT_66839 [Cantharellus anzutake]